MGTVQFYPGKRSIVSILRRLGPFNQVFGKVMEWLILGFHEIIRMFYERSAGEVFKVIKSDHFLVYLAV